MATDLGKVGMRTRGTWGSSATYEVLDVVTYNNGLYIAKQAVPANTEPTNTTYWQKAIDIDSIQTQIDTIVSNYNLDHQMQMYTSAQTISKEIEAGATYVFYTVGGGGSYTFCWLVTRAGTYMTTVPLVEGSSSTVSITVTNYTVTVNCSNTTIRMGYSRIG